MIINVCDAIFKFILSPFQTRGTSYEKNGSAASSASDVRVSPLAESKTPSHSQTSLTSLTDKPLVQSRYVSKLIIKLNRIKMTKAYENADNLFNNDNVSCTVIMNINCAHIYTRTVLSYFKKKTAFTNSNLLFLLATTHCIRKVDLWHMNRNKSSSLQTKKIWARKRESIS